LERVFAQGEQEEVPEARSKPSGMRDRMFWTVTVWAWRLRRATALWKRRASPRDWSSPPVVPPPSTVAAAAAARSLAHAPVPGRRGWP